VFVVLGVVAVVVLVVLARRALRGAAADVPIVHVRDMNGRRAGFAPSSRPRRGR
jgi:hypothetical protein